jgi:hypothetical protein
LPCLPSFELAGREVEKDHEQGRGGPHDDDRDHELDDADAPNCRFQIVVKAAERLNVHVEEYPPRRAQPQEAERVSGFLDAKKSVTVLRRVSPSGG